MSAFSNPQGGVVTNGTAVISSSGNTTTINQSSQQAIVNWNSFNIAAGEKTQFNQPANGVALNRINPHMGASQIYGQLDANGRVILVNAAGIHFGPGANVNVGSIIASTSDISNRNFRDGNYVFNRPSKLAGSIVNEGRITTANYGLAALLGTSVLNTGVIRANLGSIALGAGSKFTLNFTGDNLINFEVNGAASTVGVDSNGNKLKSGVSNTGKLISNGGQILVTANMASNVIDNVIDMRGVAEARSVYQTAGEIILSGDNGNVLVSGILNASGRHHLSAGGLIEVLGKNIELTSTAVLDAVGATGGGNVYIGGNEHGTGPLPDAVTTTIDHGAVIDASALDSGNGGNVIVWSDVLTNYAGNIKATGGDESGNGGFSEVSGHQVLNFSGGNVDLTAAHGTEGTLLLDPENVTIQTNGTSSAPITSGVFTPTTSNSILTVADLQAALVSANVNVTTGSTGMDTGDITVANALTWSSSNTLTLTAANNIYLNSSITATNGGLTLSAVGSVLSGNEATSTGVTANINLANFNLAAGKWTQVSASLPVFNITNNFQIASGNLPTSTTTQFIRASGGSGSSGSPYQIVDVFGLEGIGSNSVTLADSYVLANDIDATVTQYWSNPTVNGFLPIGYTSSNFNGNLTGVGLAGTINGQSHVVANLYELSTQNPPFSDEQMDFGLVSSMLANSVVENIGMVNENITGVGYLQTSGGIVGFMAGGLITNSYTTGSLTKGYFSGGIAGQMGVPSISSSQGSITDSFSTMSVNALQVAGGIVSESEGSVSNTYATGNIYATNGNVGGIAGINFMYGTITNTLSTGTVQGGDTQYTPAGGIAGSNSGSITSSFWDTSTSGQSYSAGGTGGCLGGGSCANGGTANLSSQATYTSNGNNWNFSTTWAINGSYPYLKTISQLLEGKVTGAGANENVNIYSNGTLLTTAITNASGAFSYATSGLASGLNLLFVLTNGASPANAVTISNIGNMSVTLAPNTVQLGDAFNSNTITNATITSATNGLSSSNILYSVAGNTLTVGNTTDHTVNLLSTAGTTYSLGVVNYSSGSSGNVTLNGPVTLAQTGDSVTTTGAISFGSTINGAVAGADTLTLSGASNTLLGTVGNNASLAALTLSGGGTDTLGSNVSTTGIQNYNDAVQLTGSSIQLSSTNSAVNFSSTLNGATSLTLATGTGLDTFTGAVGLTTPLTSLRTTGSGLVSFAAGIGSSTSLQGSINIAGSATLNGGANAGIYTSGTQTYSGTVTLASNVSFVASSTTLNSVVGNGNTLAINSGTINGVFSDGSGVSSLNQDGTGTLILKAANTFSGATTVDGVLSLMTSGNLADSAVTIANTAGTEMMLNNLNVTVSGLAGGGTTGGNVLLGSGSLKISNSTAETYAGVISGTGSITEAGSNTLTLSGNNTFTGATTIQSGTLNLSNANALADSSGVNVSGAFELSNIAVSLQAMTLNGGTLTASGSSSISNNIALTASTNDVIGTVGSTDTLTLSGTINGAANLNLQGGHVVLLGNVGTTTKLASVTSTAASTTLHGNVSTTGNQSYNGAVVLTGSTNTLSVANNASSIALNGGVSGTGLVLSASTSGSGSFALAGMIAVNSIVVNGGSGSNNSLTVQSNNAQTFNITANNVGNVTGANSGTLTFNSIQNLVGGSVSNDFVFANNTLIASINGTGNSNNKVDNSASTNTLTDTITADNTGTVQLSGSTMNFSHIQNLIGAGSSTLVVSESTPNEIVLMGKNSGYVNDPTNFNGFTTFTSSGSGATSVDFVATPNAVFSTSNSAYYINTELTFNNINSYSGNFTGITQPVAATVSASVTAAQIVSFLNYIPNVVNSNNSSTSSVLPAPTQPASKETSIQIDGAESYDGSLITIQYLMPQPTYPDARKHITTAYN